MCCNVLLLDNALTYICAPLLLDMFYHVTLLRFSQNSEDMRQWCAMLDSFTQFWTLVALRDNNAKYGTIYCQFDFFEGPKHERERVYSVPSYCKLVNWKIIDFHNIFPLATVFFNIITHYKHTFPNKVMYYKYCKTLYTVV